MYGRKWKNSKPGKKRNQNDKQAKLDSMSSMLSTCQINCLVITISIFLAAALVMTAFTSDMLIYDEGNVYSCPVDHLDEKLAAKYAETDDEGKGYQIDPISHQQFEDMFYDPMACKPFYQNNEAPIWYGRVEDMKKLNQKIFVYGFVTSKLGDKFKNLNQEFQMQFSM